MSDAVRQHAKSFWADHPQEEFSWEFGPAEKRVPGLRIRRIAPLRRSDPWVYLTVGASAVDNENGLEFFILAPEESPTHVETLALVASFHADPRYRLSVGRTIEIGRSWIEESPANHLLVSLPYPFGPLLQHCETADGHVQILWLLPITVSEAKFAQEQGLEALEQVFDASNADMISPVRQSLI